MRLEEGDLSQSVHDTVISVSHIRVTSRDSSALPPFFALVRKGKVLIKKGKNQVEPFLLIGGRCRGRRARAKGTRAHLNVETNENVGWVGVIEPFRDRASNVHERMKKFTKISRILLKAHDNAIASQLLLSHLEESTDTVTKVDIFVRTSDDEQRPRSHSRVLKHRTRPGRTEEGERNGFAGETVDG